MALNILNGFDVQQMLDTMEATAPDPATINAKVERDPVHGIVTALSGSSVLLKAGASELSGRTQLIVKNTSDRCLVKYGATSANAIYQDGLPINPGETVVITFETGTAISVYARSQGEAVKLEVTEI